MERERIMIDFRGMIDGWGDYGRDGNGIWRASSLAGVRMAVEGSPKGADIVLNIDSDGGSVSEGLKIYDYLTTYDYGGGQLYTNIVGACHSMAVVVLLTAPLANRSANANIRALIHEVRTWGDDITVEEAERLARQLQMEQDAILDIYAARTTSERGDLEAIMREEREHTAQELLDWGFISSINSLSVNSYLRNSKHLSNDSVMAKKFTNLFNEFVCKARKLRNGADKGEIVNFDYKDGEGVIVFFTDTEDDDLAVGATVEIADGSTGGTFTLDDGRKVTIVDNTVTEIVLPEDTEGGEEGESDSADPAPAENGERIAELEALLQTATETINAQMAEIRELQTEVARLTASNHKPAGRPANAMPKTDIDKTPERSTEEIKTEANERRMKAFSRNLK